MKKDKMLKKVGDTISTDYMKNNPTYNTKDKYSIPLTPLIHDTEKRGKKGKKERKR